LAGAEEKPTVELVETGNGGTAQREAAGR
jgi:hypothetical protein